VGVKILPRTIIGTTVTSNSYWINGKELQMPEFQAVLIDDDTRAEGPAFLVWLFNKVTSVNKDSDELLMNGIANEGNEMKNKDHRAFLRVWVEPLNLDSNLPEIVFKSYISMWLELRFPAVLLKLFPIRKSKAEELCSAAIVKSLRASFSPAFDNFCKAYDEWLCNPLADINLKT